jgi:FKBP-type peptidyl-prolyl cis-trans isomerase SlpA
MIALCEQPQRGEEIAMPQVGPGTYITIRFEAFLESGTRVLSNEDETPLVFRFGSGEVFSRIEQEIAGLSAGDIREFFIQPEEAFGRIDHAKILRVPLQDFPRGKELKRGMVLRVETKEGRKNLCFVGDIQKDHFVLDFNHPLAGKTLKYRVRVLDVHKIT